MSEALEAAERLLEERDLHAAEEMFRAAQSRGDDTDRCDSGLWMALMLRGDFEAAWQQNDQIRKRNIHDPHRLWNGESVATKRVIVRCLHGFGDTVQMACYLPLLRQHCAHLILEVPPRMMDVAACFKGADEIVTWGEQAPREPTVWDVQIEIMELPYLFRTQVSDLPIAFHYLDLPDGLLTHVSASLGQPYTRRVGLVWSTGEWNLTRAIPFEHVRAITSLEGIEFWNLQGGSEQSKWSMLTPRATLRDGAEAGDGILNLAAVIRQMDLVITPDTLAAHLAGALGVKAWVLLQHAADWRWMHECLRSPWYPSLRLFRQATQGNWDPVIADVLNALPHWEKQHG